MPFPSTKYIIKYLPMNYGAKMISRGPEKSRKTADLIPACPDCAAQCVSLKLYDGLTAAGGCWKINLFVTSSVKYKQAN